MPALLTNKFRHKMALEIALNRALDEYYITCGRPTAFDNDSVPPTPTDSVQSAHIDVYRHMIFGKRVVPDDIRLMVQRNDWVSGTVYTAYDHENTQLFAKDTKFFVVVNEGLFYSVFKCLSNNGGVPSVYRPSLYDTAADDEFYTTADGYQWKYMYTIPKSLFEKFATVDYIPVVANTAVTANASPGAVETIQVVSPGSRYNAYHSGSIQAARIGGNNQLYAIDPSAAGNTDFYKNSVLKVTSGPGAGQQRVIADYIVSGGYKRVLVNQPFDPANSPTEESTYEISPNIVVEGSGTGFVGRAIINAVSNTIYAVEITNKGAGYSWANAIVVSNTGIVNSASNTYIQANNAILRVVISPPGGHGSDVESELGATRVCISQTVNTTQSGNKIVAENEFRTVSVIKNPLFANVEITISDAVGTFGIGDLVVQPFKTALGVGYNYGTIASSGGGILYLRATKGVMSLTDADFSTANPVGAEFVYGPIYNSNMTATGNITGLGMNNPGLYFDQTTTLYGTVSGSAQFTQDETVVQNDQARGTVLSANSSTIKLVNTRGVFVSVNEGSVADHVVGDSSRASASIDSIQLPDVIPESGEVIYIENIAPIARANGQTETVKVILEF